MGHYDSCYEAEETRETERNGKRLKENIEKLADYEAGLLHDHLKNFIHKSRFGHATYDEHMSLKYSREFMRNKLGLGH